MVAQINVTIQPSGVAAGYGTVPWSSGHNFTKPKNSLPKNSVRTNSSHLPGSLVDDIHTNIDRFRNIYGIQLDMSADVLAFLEDIRGTTELSDTAALTNGWDSNTPNLALAADAENDRREGARSIGRRRTEMIVRFEEGKRLFDSTIAQFKSFKCTFRAIFRWRPWWR